MAHAIGTAAGAQVVCDCCAVEMGHRIDVPQVNARYLSEAGSPGRPCDICEQPLIARAMRPADQTTEAIDGGTEEGHSRPSDDDPEAA